VAVTSTGDLIVYNIGEAIELSRIAVLVTTATVSSGNIVVTVYQRPTYGSTSGQVTIGTLTIPTATTAGSIYYKPVESVRLLPGQQLAFNCSTAAAGGSNAGAVISMFKAFMTTEDPRNVAAMTLSA